MKTLVVYSSLTGNTKKIADAIAEVWPKCDIYPVETAPQPKGYTIMAVGYWVDKGQPDKKARVYLESLHDQYIALFGTLGASPESDHAKNCKKNAEAIITLPGKNNHLIGSFLCQGRIDPKLIETLIHASPHSITPERYARWAEANTHPNEDDCHRAKELFSEFLIKAEKRKLK